MDAPWRKVRPYQAKKMKSELGIRGGEAQEVTSDELDDLIGDGAGTPMVP